MATRTRWLVAALLIILGAAGFGHWARARSQRAALLRADLDTVPAKSPLGRWALARGAHAYADACAPCHGPHGRGDRAIGVPDLADGEHLYGSGLASEIELIILHGIRSHESKGWNLASMPAYATAKPYGREAIAPLAPRDIADVVAFLRSRSHHRADAAAAARGSGIYATRGGCWDCHGQDAEGDPAIGAPSLVDTTWLYGDGSAAALADTIAHGRHGVSPAFARRMDPGDARAVALFVAALAPAGARP